MAVVAVLLAQGFEDVEFRIPYNRLARAGHRVELIGMSQGELVQGERGAEKLTTQAAPSDREPSRYDALLIPGGRAPERLRLDPDVLSFVRRFFESGRVVAAVCHGPQVLARAGVVMGRTLTSSPHIREALEDAGAHWVNREVVEDGPLITSRKPDDLEAFTRVLLRRLEDVGTERWAAP